MVFLSERVQLHTHTSSHVCTSRVGRGHSLCPCSCTVLSGRSRRLYALGHVCTRGSLRRVTNPVNHYESSRPRRPRPKSSDGGGVRCCHDGGGGGDDDDDDARCPTPREASLGLNRGPAARWHRGQTLLPPLSRAVCITFVVEVFGSQPGARLRPVRQRCQWRRDFSGRRDKWWHGWRRSEAARRPRDWAWVRVRKSHLRSRED